MVLRLINVMEILVKDTIDEVLKANKNLCGCDRCRLDIAAIALNKLAPSYVVTVEGEVMLRAGALRQQSKVDIIRSVTEALDAVSKRPHHTREQKQ